MSNTMYYPAYAFHILKQILMELTNVSVTNPGHRGIVMTNTNWSLTEPNTISDMVVRNRLEGVYNTIYAMLVLVLGSPVHEKAEIAAWVNSRLAQMLANLNNVMHTTTDVHSLCNMLDRGRTELYEEFLSRRAAIDEVKRARAQMGYQPVQPMPGYGNWGPPLGSPFMNQPFDFKMFQDTLQKVLSQQDGIMKQMETILLFANTVEAVNESPAGVKHMRDALRRSRELTDYQNFVRDQRVILDYIHDAQPLHVEYAKEAIELVQDMLSGRHIVMDKGLMTRFAACSTNIQKMRATANAEGWAEDRTKTNPQQRHSWDIDARITQTYSEALAVLGFQPHEEFDQLLTGDGRYTDKEGNVWKFNNLDEKLRMYSWPRILVEGTQCRVLPGNVFSTFNGVISAFGYKTGTHDGIIAHDGRTDGLIFEDSFGCTWSYTTKHEPAKDTEGRDCVHIVDILQLDYVPIGAAEATRK